MFVQVDNVRISGGPAAMMKFLADNIRYPVIAQENGIQGRVICSLVIDEEGMLPSLVCCGAWTRHWTRRFFVSLTCCRSETGMHEGKPVSVWAVMPVVFRLQGDEPQDPLLSQEDKEALRPDRMDVFESDEGLIFDELVVVGYGLQTQINGLMTKRVHRGDEQPIFREGRKV